MATSRITVKNVRDSIVTIATEPSVSPGIFNKDVLIHFFGHKVLSLAGVPQRLPPQQTESVLLHALKLAFVVTARQLIIPTSSIAQSPYFLRVLPHLSGIIANDHVAFCGSEIGVAELMRSRQSWQAIYPVYKHRATEAALETTAQAWVRRSRSTTLDVSEGWMHAIVESIDTVPDGPTWPDSLLLDCIYRRIARETKLSSFYDRLFDIPDKLDGMPFLWDSVALKHLLPSPLPMTATRLCEQVLLHQWLLSHIREYDPYVLCFIPYLGSIDYGMRYSAPDAVLDCRRLLDVLRSYCLLPLLNELTLDMLAELRSTKLFQGFRDKALARDYTYRKSATAGPMIGASRETRLRERVHKVVSTRRDPLSKAWLCLKMVMEA